MTSIPPCLKGFFLFTIKQLIITIRELSHDPHVHKFEKTLNISLIILLILSLLLLDSNT
jgi:hypothetical protein